MQTDGILKSKNAKWNKFDICMHSTLLVCVPTKLEWTHLSTIYDSFAIPFNTESDESFLIVRKSRINPHLIALVFQAFQTMDVHKHPKTDEIVVSVVMIKRSSRWHRLVHLPIKRNE